MSLLATPARADGDAAFDLPEQFPVDIIEAPPLAFDPVPTEAFNSQAAQIADWIVENSDYSEGISLPAFIRLPGATLNYFFYSKLVGGYQGQDCINALYLPHLIMLADDLDVSKCTDTLVHELTHQFQFSTGRSFRSNGRSRA